MGLRFEARFPRPGTAGAAAVHGCGDDGARLNASRAEGRGLRFEVRFHRRRPSDHTGRPGRPRYTGAPEVGPTGSALGSELLSDSFGEEDLQQRLVRDVLLVGEELELGNHRLRES
jgi:hypothetical protein